jgi:HNH endonuclease
MVAEPGWCAVCGLPVPAGERVCAWPFGARADDGHHDGEVVPWASHSLAFMTELVEAQHWSCPWCGDCLPDSPAGTAIDHIVPRVYGGPHRRWNLQLLHQGCNSAKGKKITAEALELADAHGVRISADSGHYRAGVRRRAAIYAVRATLQLGGEARDRALAEARNLTVFFPEARVRAVIRAAAEEPRAAAARPAMPAKHPRPADH